MNTDIAAQHAIDRLAKSGPNALTEDEKTLAAAWLFDAGVGNSGFVGYFSGHRSDLAFDGPRALRAIGASRMAMIAEDANAVFGPGGPPHDRAARREAVHHLAAEAKADLAALDQRYESCTEDIDDLLEQFMARKSKPDAS